MDIHWDGHPFYIQSFPQCQLCTNNFSNVQKRLRHYHVQPRISCTSNKAYELKVLVRDLVGKYYLGIYIHDANGVCPEDASQIVSTVGFGK